jgi:hypothetical protein
MSLQKIINSCNQIQVNRRRVVGVQSTRNETYKTAETPTRNPWKFSIQSSNAFPYSLAREMLEELDRIDTRTYEDVSFAGVSSMSWLFAYQGDMTSSDIARLTVTSFIGNQLTLGNLPSMAAGGTMFKPNDIIQIVGYPYPFTIMGPAITQANQKVGDVLRGNGSTLTVTTHRPNFIIDNIIGRNVVVGNAVKFRMICPNMPTYKLVPGAQIMSATGQLINNARIEFDSTFDMVEFTDSQI